MWKNTQGWNKKKIAYFVLAWIIIVVIVDILIHVPFWKRLVVNTGIAFAFIVMYLFMKNNGKARKPGHNKK